MSVAFVDGFDHYPTDKATIGYGLNTPWIVVLTGSDFRSFATGLNGLGKCLVMGANSNGGYMRRVIPTTSQISYHFGVMITNLPATLAEKLIEFDDVSGARQFQLNVTIGGLLQLIGEGGAILATGSILLSPNVVYRISLKADLDTGTFALAISGDEDPNFTLTGVDLNDQTSTDIGFVRYDCADSSAEGGAQFALEYRIDDVVCLYDEAILIPECELLLAGPNADTADSDWVPSTGTDNYAMVDEVPVDGDATYNSSDVVGALDLFDFAGLVKSPESIVCITQLTVARKEESATRTFKNVLKIGATEYQGVEHFLSTSSTYYYDHYRDNPADSLPWEEADYAALKSGYELTV